MTVGVELGRTDGRIRKPGRCALGVRSTGLGRLRSESTEGSWPALPAYGAGRSSRSGGPKEIGAVEPGHQQNSQKSYGV